MNLAQSPPIVLALLIIYLLIKDAVIPLIKKKNGKLHTVQGNPNSKPGNAQACKENRDKITKLETKVENLKEKVDQFCQQNREDHQKIFERLRIGGN